MKKWWCLLLVLLLAGCNEREQAVVSTWIWDTPTAIADARQTVDFLAAQQIREVYVQYDPSITDEQYASFFKQLKKQRINVFALDGHTAWLQKPSGMDNFTSWVTQFQQRYQLLDGVHADIEPYTLPDWVTNQATYITAYQALVETLQTITDEFDIELQLAIPFWFDEVPLPSAVQGNVAEWLIDHADTVVMMAYRNQAADVLPLVQQEIDYANAVHKRVIVALETARSEEGANISFYDQPLQNLTDEVNEIHATLQQEKAYHGVAIHSYHSWREMK